MELWNIDKAVNAIKNETLSEWEKAKYYIGWIVLQLILSAANEMVRRPHFGVIGVVSYSLAAFVGIVGVTACFNVNKKRDNKNFLERVAIIGLPLNIRISVLFWAIYILLFNIGLRAKSGVAISTVFTIYGLFSASAYYALFFYVLKNKLAKI
ncbi:MAG: hypothetical protein QNJ72_17400 [Pleurocapsa sp. MO_226.B13]|nr:hypothetical protein [Pleurocapsa sp. MO_226.B13]